MDPNKYKGNANIRPDTLMQTITSVVSMVLMLVGIIGIATDFFKEDSWIKNTLAYLFQSTATMLLIPLIVVVLWFLNRLISSPNKGQKKNSGNLPMYLMMVIGAYYVYQFLLG